MLYILSQQNVYKGQAHLTRTFSSTWHHWLWNLSLSADYYSIGTWHMGRPQRLLVCDL